MPARRLALTQVVLLAASLVVVSCDSSGPIEEETLRLKDSPADTTLRVGSGIYSLSLSDYFVHSCGPDVTYALSVSGTALTGGIVGDTLVLEAVQVGLADISVAAKCENQVWKFTFRVHVIDAFRIELRSTPPDTSLFVDYGDYRLSLDESFIHNCGTAITYNVSTSSDIVSVEFVGNWLHVTADAIGESRVTVLASCGAEALDVAFLVSTKTCPSRLTDDQASYFPNDIGHQWTYDYSGHEYDPQVGYVEDTTTGTATWQIVRREDQCTRLYLGIRETFQGSTHRRYDGELPDTTFAVEWGKTRNATFVGDSLRIDGLWMDLIRWKYPNTTPDAIRVDSTLFCGFGGCTRGSYEIQREVGLVHYYYDFSHRSFWQESFTLQP